MSDRLSEWIRSHSLVESRQVVAFSIVMSVNFPLFYFIWMFDRVNYENLWLRLSASCLCLPLIWHQKWPLKFQKYLSCYFYFTILYCLPFFFTFMTLMNHSPTLWLMNSVSAIFFIMLLVDTSMFFILTAFGIFAGIFAFFIFYSGVYFICYTQAVNFYEIVATFFAVIVIGMIFAHSKFLVEKEKLVAMKALSANIAHELRTPLAGLQSAVNGLERYYPSLVHAYAVAKKADLPVEKIRSAHFRALESFFKTAIVEIRYAHMIIDVLLKNHSAGVFDYSKNEKHSIKVCIEEALLRYPFISASQRALVDWEGNDTFYFHGDKLLFIHIIFNLLKNSLYFIDKAQKGKISIWIECGEKNNFLHFKDTASGISAENVKQLFVRFHTTEKHGSGLGLFFCKSVMQGLGGDIRCRTEEGVFTEFVLCFPRFDAST